MGNVIRFTEQNLHAIIKESIQQILNEAFEDVCTKLQAIQGRFGQISQINLPEGVSVKDIENEDIRKITSNPSATYYLKLAGGMYVTLSDDAPAIVKALHNQKERDILRQSRASQNDAGPARIVPELSPEEHKEAQRLLRQRDKIERGDPNAFKSMRQVQDYIEQKYGEHLELFTKRTRRGREWVYEARITYVASSYANGPSYVSDECVKAVTNFLRPFGFYYAGCKEDHDERKWSTNGWHIWYREGYNPDSYLRRSMYDDFPEWMQYDGY